MAVSRISRSAAAVVAGVAMALIPPSATGQVQAEPAATDSSLEERAPRPEGPAEPSAEVSAPEAATPGDRLETPGPVSPAAGAATKAFDVIVTRPLGLCSLVLGFTFFSITAPFVAATPGTDIPASWDLFVLSRWDYTFVRPLGEL